MTVTYTIGDTRDVIATIPDGSVSLIATSPPFIQLRSYLPADHPDKHAEIGSEPDPAAFIDTLLELTAEWGRVLAPWGSIAIELGDTFAGSGGAGGDYNDGGLRKGQPQFDGSTKYLRTHDPAIGPPISRVSGTAGGGGGAGWPRAKCLALVPQAYALSLAYGRNVLTGQPSPAGQWLVRNVITWHRPNPAVGALGDKYRPSTSQIVVATRSAKRWFDLTAVRGEPSPNTHARTAVGVAARATTGKTAEKDGNFHTLDTLHLTAGAPPLDAWFDEYDGTTDTWTLTTQPSKLAHYAMWPAKLAERLILSMCPAWVCLDCSRPLDSKYVRTNTVPGMQGADRGSVGKVAGGAVEAPLLLEGVRESSNSPQPQIDHLSTAHDSRVRGALEAESPDGQQRRLHHGAPLPDGRAPRPTAVAGGSCASSQRDQVGQPDQQPRGDGQASARPCAEAEAAPIRLSELRGTSGELRHALACPSCGSSDLARGVVLDPFSGTGTTLAVADLHGRDAIGIDIDARNQQLYEQRRAECARNLFDSPMPDTNQLDLFGGVA